MIEQRQTELEAEVQTLSWKVDHLTDEMKEMRAEVREDIRAMNRSIQDLVSHYSRLDERVPKAPPKKYSLVVTGVSSVLTTAAIYVLNYFGINIGK